MPVSPYTRERLQEAASSSRTLSEALGKLGVDPKSPTRRYVHTRMRRWGVDTAHFEREGVRWTREVLEVAVSASTNMCEVLRRLGLDVVGGHHTHISRRVKALGIDTSHFVPEVRTGRRRRTAEDLLVEQDPAHPRREQSARLKRAMLGQGMKEACAMCGIEAVWLGEPLPLEVDHIDGNWRDNWIENLRLLCPNCHSTTDTYRGRGKKRQRSPHS
ncbi:HNH endonuclease signature motif containing protein [Streptomyces apricus]|uniref:HNH endonuclease n=1 Tax=Streptomyces apricus TaxID=1828112 RepID=A0A5B0AKB8_9ACTN|nr:HNH endonuclease [Streptomyces apricus]KAA0930413.1 HNH endonuclease [Streptomyces apricus]